MSVIFVVFYPRPPCMQVTGEAAALLFLADLSSQSIMGLYWFLKTNQFTNAVKPRQQSRRLTANISEQRKNPSGTSSKQPIAG